MWPKRSRIYQVTPERDDWVAPEETLVDASSEFAAVEVPVGDAVFRVAYIVVGVVCAILVGAVLWLGVVRYDFYSQLSMRNKTINVSVPPPRGIIMDRNGVPLVQNVPSFDLIAISRQIRREVDGTIQGIAMLARVLQRDPQELSLSLEQGIRSSAVFFAATDLSRAQVLALNSVVPLGFSIITSTKRQYVDGAQFSHLIGYVGKVSAEDLSRDSYYLPSDTIGRLGIESQYESVLRGVHGQLSFETSTGTANHPAVSGGNVVLALDMSVQKNLWNSLWSVLKQAGLSRAAAIVQDPRDGSVLGMVSFPAYDNNVFNGPYLSQDDFESLFENPLQPLFNRVISGKYNPGSTIKPFIGMTALQEHVVTADQLVTHDCISLTVPNPSNPEHPYVYKNWRPDTGYFDLNRAIANSCNIYFFTVGGGHDQFVGLGVNRITNYLADGYANRMLGIDLPGEVSGFIPTPDWKYATTKEPWYLGDTYNISIGQGDLSVTPLWINSYISAIANGGTIWQPRVASRIVDEQRNTLQTISAHADAPLPFSAEVIHQMQIAMRHTVTEGTGRIFADLPVSVAAKTGTAEVIKGKRVNSLVTLYAPADNPQIALTVLIEGSTVNQSYALIAARQFLGKYFAQ